jgi:integrase
MRHRGCIEHRGNSIRIVLRYKDLNTGESKQYKETIAGGTYRQAQKRITELQHQLDRGININPEKVTLAEFAPRWLHDYAKPNVRPRVYKYYADIIENHLIPRMGNTPLHAIKKGTLASFYSDLSDNGRLDGNGGLSNTSINHIHACLHGILQVAKEWELISNNVCDDVRPPPMRPKEKETWTSETITKFLESIKDNQYYPVLHTLIYTGMRRSELLGLRWKDVDLEKGFLRVNQSMHQLAKGQFDFEPPKTAAGKRPIPLHAEAVKVLEEHKARIIELRTYLGMPELSGDDLVFTRLPSFEPIRPDTLTHTWTILVNRSGLPYINLHSARHTFASVLLGLDVNIKTIQEILGHSNPATTMRIYAHVKPQTHRDATQAFGDALKNGN